MAPSRDAGSWGYTLRHCIQGLFEGHGSLVAKHGLVTGVSYVRALIPLKTHHIEGLMRIKSVEAQSSHIGVMGKIGERGLISGVLFFTWSRFKITRSVSNIFRVAL
ncbi:hypothetical protein TNCV_3599801 [Trichonephila clavipes]|nr:hypothetical protein TNCV_3599801 [Trichonephila clavipes]